MSADPDTVPPHVDIVIPTVGRPSLTTLLDRLDRQPRPWRGRVIVVDDSEDGRVVLPPSAPADAVVVRTGGRRGPAAARNAGWKEADAPFVAFLDDDVVPGDRWAEDLVADVSDWDASLAAVQARITVPRPADATDWERNTARLEAAPWITADLLVRRDALVAVHGFDERFPRAYREDTDLAVRLLAAGWRLASGRRQTTHPVRPAPWWVSVRMQAGNADDILLERLHGPRIGVLGHERGRHPRHQAIVAALLGAVLATLAGRRRVAALLGVGWLTGTALFAWERIRPGPRTRREVAAMAVTSVAIPPVAVWHRVRGRLRHRHPSPWPITQCSSPASASRPPAPTRSPRQSVLARHGAALWLQRTSSSASSA